MVDIADSITTGADDGRTGGVIARPQPVGVFPLPAGYLLVPSGEGHDEVRAALCDGRLPTSFPTGLAFYERALAGDLDGARDAIDAALDALDGVVAGGFTGDPAEDSRLADHLVLRVDRLVVEPTEEALASLVADADALGDVDLRVYVETIGFATGLRREPPVLRLGERIDGEIAALWRAARATSALEAGDGARAIEELESAAQAAQPVSAALTGQLMGQLANCQLDEGGVQRAAVTFQAALDQLAGTDLDLSRADLHVAAGAMYQEMSEAAPRLMQQAIDHYHQATALVSAETAPETWAIANANLGLAYLTMPMNEASDQLRIGVAVQAMRSALEVFTPQSHPDRWSSTQLNLANALVYMPSKHQADNIAEAVGLYEGVLQHRSREFDPAGRARVLANQGNALAHLGVFADAKARLHEARSLFEELGDDDAVRTVRSILDEIAREESVARQDRS